MTEPIAKRQPPDDMSGDKLRPATSGSPDPRSDNEVPAHQGAGNDIQLMALVKKGDTDAFRKIISRHQASLVNFFRRCGADINRAEECTQETFIKLYNYRRKYKPTSKFTTFLYTLARHSWVDELRRQKRRPKQVADWSEVDAPAKQTPNDLAQREDIEIALSKLSDKLRITVVLSIYQGLNYEEIARTLKIPSGTVKSRMSLAFEQLRKVLSHE